MIRCGRNAQAIDLDHLSSWINPQALLEDDISIHFDPALVDQLFAGPSTAHTCLREHLLKSNLIPIWVRLTAYVPIRHYSLDINLRFGLESHLVHRYLAGSP